MRRSDEGRTKEALERHYEIERELADRLRGASPKERGALYASLYDELYRRVPDHPLVARRSSPEETARKVASRMLLLRRFVGAETTFLEIGAGDCALSLEVAALAKEAIAVEVSREIAARAEPRTNFRLIFSDGIRLPVRSESVDVAYSEHVIEHLHPEDALEQTREVLRVLRAGGAYVCLTPNRLSGPHDISKYFGGVARGLHLKEYTCAELARLLREIGFARVRAYVRVGRRYASPSLAFVRLCETALGSLPLQARRRLCGNRFVSGFLGVRIVAWKQDRIRR